jgi:hypothetical protein
LSDLSLRDLQSAGNHPVPPLPGEAGRGGSQASEVTERPELEPVLFAATVRAPVAPMHAEPGVASPMISQQLAGHRVEVVDIAGEWVRAAGPDRYDGWIHQGFLVRETGVPATERADPRSMRLSLGCIADNGCGPRALPLRALLGPDEVVQSGEVIDAKAAAKRFVRDRSAITRTAQEFFHGTSYLWGGVTPWGADCSGLVQSTFALHGVSLPRDAWQQSGAGEDAGRQIAALRPADLLFFSDRDDRHVTHVGISLGGWGMVHLALGRGGYGIEQLDDVGNGYVEKLRERFLFARRVL